MWDHLMVTLYTMVGDDQMEASVKRAEQWLHVLSVPFLNVNDC